MYKGIDMNCDMGESYGIYKLGFDEKVIRYITSANLACGFHAGDPDVMDKSIKLALENNVRIGAHPGYSDLKGFGRRKMELRDEELVNLLTYQVGAIEALCKKNNASLNHFKLHGALGNLADINYEIASVVIKFIKNQYPFLTVYTKPNSKMEMLAKDNGLSYMNEIYADREYNNDLTLVSRSSAGAVLNNPILIGDRIEKMLKTNKVVTFQGKEVEIRGQSVCVHGDTLNSLEIIKELATRLSKF